VTESPESRQLDARLLEKALAGGRFGNVLEYRPSVDSTNALARTLARAGAPEGTVILADEQTRGKGRGNHTWLSTKGLGLYLSLLLRPDKELLNTPVFGLLGGVAGVLAVQEVSGLKTALKWPNDLLVQDRKAGGILAEAIPAVGGKDAIVVLGIGINLLHDRLDLPENTPVPPTSLKLEGWTEPDRIRLISRLVRHCERLYDDLRSGGIEPLQQEVLSIWAERHQWVVLDGGNPPAIRGRAVSLDLAGGHLILQNESGQEITVSLNRFLRLKRIPEILKPGNQDAL